jgi:hypothetical protein
MGDRLKGIEEDVVAARVDRSPMTLSPGRSRRNKSPPASVT